MQHVTSHRFLGKCQMAHTWRKKMQKALDVILCKLCGIRSKREMGIYRFVPVVHSPYKTAVINNWQGVESTYGNNVHNPTVKPQIV